MRTLEGFIDVHIHTSPDVRERKLDDIEAARSAREAGMDAIVLKSHVTLTADRARIAESVVSGIRVFGSLTLNDPVGGINPSAVEAAIALGAKIIWLPTISSRNHRLFHKQAGGIHLLDEEGKIIPELMEVFEIIKGTDAILATGHVSVEETIAVVPAAKAQKVEKILITHPEVPWIHMSIAVQKDLLKYGVFFERCYASTLEIGGNVPFGVIVEAIRELGTDSTVISTDYGAAALEEPVKGFERYICALEEADFSRKQIMQMGSRIPKDLLDLSREGSIDVQKNH